MTILSTPDMAMPCPDSYIEASAEPVASPTTAPELRLNPPIDDGVARIPEVYPPRAPRATPLSSAIAAGAGASHQPLTTIHSSLLSSLASHCSLSHDAAITAVLWVLHTYAFNLRGFSPILLVNSESSETGKSTLLDWLATVVAHPFAASNPGAKLLQPIMAESARTMVLDDITRFSNGLNEILVTGHQKTKGGLWVPGKKDKPVIKSTTWSPKAIATTGIGHIPEAVVSRSIEIRMERKPASLQLKRPCLHQRNEALASAATEWVTAHAQEIASVTPELPPSIGNRLKDNWEPLLAIADILGGEWPVWAREAMLKLRNAKDTVTTEEILWLHGVRAFFNRTQLQVAFSEEIVHWLNKEMRLNGTSNRVTAKQLAAAMSQFGIRTNQTVRRNSHTAKGYYRRWFTNVFDQYLCTDPSLPKSQDYAPAETLAALRAQISPVTTVPAVQAAPPPQPGSAGIPAGESLTL